MTEKQFELPNPNHMWLIYGDKPYAHWIADYEKIVDLLNELNEQKEYWKEKYKQELEKNSIITVAYDKQGNPHILTKKELEE